MDNRWGGTGKFSVIHPDEIPAPVPEISAALEHEQAVAARGGALATLETFALRSPTRESVAYAAANPPNPEPELLKLLSCEELIANSKECVEAQTKKTKDSNTSARREIPVVSQGLEHYLDGVSDADFDNSISSQFDEEHDPVLNDETTSVAQDRFSKAILSHMALDTSQDTAPPWHETVCTSGARTREATDLKVTPKVEIGIIPTNNENPNTIPIVGQVQTNNDRLYSPSQSGERGLGFCLPHLPGLGDGGASRSNQLPFHPASLNQNLHDASSGMRASTIRNHAYFHPMFNHDSTQNTVSLSVQQRTVTLPTLHPPINSNIPLACQLTALAQNSNRHGISVLEQHYSRNGLSVTPFSNQSTQEINIPAHVLPSSMTNLNSIPHWQSRDPRLWASGYSRGAYNERHYRRPEAGNYVHQGRMTSPYQPTYSAFPTHVQRNRSIQVSQEGVATTFKQITPRNAQFTRPLNAWTQGGYREVPETDRNPQLTARKYVARVYNAHNLDTVNESAPDTELHSSKKRRSNSGAAETTKTTPNRSRAASSSRKRRKTRTRARGEKIASQPQNGELNKSLEKKRQIRAERNRISAMRSRERTHKREMALDRSVFYGRIENEEMKRSVLKYRDYLKGVIALLEEKHTAAKAKELCPNTYQNLKNVTNMIAECGWTFRPKGTPLIELKYRPDPPKVD